MAFVVFGLAIGGLCALLRYRVLLMPVVSAFLAVGSVLGGAIFHTHPWAIVADAFGSIVALQFTYLAVSCSLHFVRSRRLILQVQTAIGQRLQAELEVPRSMPPELSALVGKLRGA